MKTDYVDRGFIAFIIAGIICIASLTIIFIIQMSKNNRINNYDVNNDGFINAQDYVAIRRYIMENN